MADRREVASKVLDDAKRVITTERGNQHGDAEDSFDMIANFWRVYLENTNMMAGNNVSVIIRREDVAEMMALLKKARKVHGSPGNFDHAVDDIGYTALAAMMVAPKPQAPAQAPSSDYAKSLGDSLKRQTASSQTNNTERQPS